LLVWAALLSVYYVLNEPNPTRTFFKMYLEWMARFLSDEDVDRCCVPAFSPSFSNQIQRTDKPCLMP